MAVTFAALIRGLGLYRNRLVVTRPAAYLLMGDRQAVAPRGILAALACLALIHTPNAWAHPWPACNAPGLTPAVGLEQPAPPYPPSAREAAAEGYVDVAFTVLRDGHVGWAHVERAAPGGFFEAAALQGVRDWLYRPAMRDGQPVECRIRTRVRFTLADAVPARLTAGTGGSDQPAPVYPAKALGEGLEGYVDVAFQGGADGRVTHAAVTTSVPRGAFDQAALEAVRHWRLPTAAAGQVQTRRFDFSLPERYPHPPAATLLAAAPLPPEACQRHIAGSVTLEVAVDADGRISDARVVRATPPGLFDDTALATARNSRIATAWRAGVPIASTALLTLDFEPDAAHCGDGGDSTGAPAAGRPASRVSALGQPASSPGPAAPACRTGTLAAGTEAREGTACR